MRKVLCSVMLAVVALCLCFAPVCLAWTVGRMTGAGSVMAPGNAVTPAGTRVTHGFTLHCDPNIGPNNLEINWAGGNHWKLETLTSISCYSDLQSPAPGPNTNEFFDIYNGCGDGSLNGTPGFHACWIFKDRGEPGTNDTAEYFISGTVKVLDVPETRLAFGNQQVHPQN